MKRTFTLALACAAMLAAMPALAQDSLAKIKEKGVLVAGVKNDYKPWGFLEPSGKIVGLLCWIILPQAARRMIAPWMNLYAILIMATTLISVVGIHDGMTMTRAALVAEGRVDL